MNYQTLTEKIEFEGIGIHTGKISKIVLTPSKKSSGINFYINNTKIPATLDSVISTYKSTVLGNKYNKILTVEHLLSTLYSLLITDVDIYVFGEEIPILDGSAKFFVQSFLDNNLKELEKIQPIFLKSHKKFFINNSIYEIFPFDNFEIYCEVIIKKSKLVNGQNFNFKFSPDSYIKEISYAKTYCFLEDVENIILKGYGLGGDLSNVIVVDKDKILNPEILTYENEFVRHKILDFLGDFSLLSKYINAKIKLTNPNHYANFEFCKIISKILN